jgi:hypothetical protein
MPKRQLKSINVKNLSKSVTTNDVENTPHFKDLIYQELYSGIQESILSNKDMVTLFELNHSGCILELEEKFWVESLKTAIKYFESKEKYETCTLFNNLIEKVNEYSRRHKEDGKSGRQRAKRKNLNEKKKENSSESEQGNIHSDNK